MKKLTKITGLALALLLAFCITSSATDATSAWNSVCAAYHFGSYPQGIHTTFEQAYSGSDFNAGWCISLAPTDFQMAKPKIPLLTPPGGSQPEPRVFIRLHWDAGSVVELPTHRYPCVLRCHPESGSSLLPQEAPDATRQ